MNAAQATEPGVISTLGAPRPTWWLRAAIAAVVISGLAVAAVLASTGSSLLDPDVWWHIRTGRLILDTHSVPHTDPFSFTAPHGGWVPTAWLSDVGFGLTWRAGGVDAIEILRVALAVSVAVAAWLVARRNRTPFVAASVATALVLVALQPFLRERPQVVSFLFVAWLAVLVDGIFEGRRPTIFATVALGWLWSNLHGMWILLPAVVVAAGVLSWLDERERRVPLAARCVLVGVLSWLAALITPAGPRVAVWPLVVRQAAAPITEWQPTVLYSRVGIPFACMVAIVIWSWARTDRRVSVGRGLYVLGVVGFGLIASRNVAPAAILLLPDLARSIVTLTPRLVAPIGPRWRLAAAMAALAVGLAGAAAVAADQPRVSRDQPVAIAERLARTPHDVRVLNYYDVGGLITGLASPPAHVAIDGRTDMWSPSYVRNYIADLSGGGDWRTLVDRLQPDVAVLPVDSDVTRGLVAERGWQITMLDGRWALLEPPGPS